MSPKDYGHSDTHQLPMTLKREDELKVTSRTLIKAHSPSYMIYMNRYTPPTKCKNLCLIKDCSVCFVIVKKTKDAVNSWRPTGAGTELGSCTLRRYKDKLLQPRCTFKRTITPQ